MRLIDADALLNHECEADRMGAMIVVGKGYILDAPTIDAVPVVRGEWAYAEAIRRHYNDMTSQCFICYSCVNHDARQKAKWDGKKLEDYACSRCGNGKPNWKFDVERFMGQEGRK